MLPDHVVYEELQRERQKREEAFERQRPYLEMPRHMPYWPESKKTEDESEEESERGVVIIQM